MSKNLILLYNDSDLELYSIKGIPKDTKNASLDTLASVVIKYCSFKIGELVPDLEDIIVAEEPTKEEIKEVHKIYKQILQVKINSGYTAINLSGREFDCGESSHEKRSETVGESLQEDSGF